MKRITFIIIMLGFLTSCRNYEIDMPHIWVKIDNKSNAKIDSICIVDSKSSDLPDFKITSDLRYSNKLYVFHDTFKIKLVTHDTVFYSGLLKKDFTDDNQGFLIQLDKSNELKVNSSSFYKVVHASHLCIGFLIITMFSKILILFLGLRFDTFKKLKNKILTLNLFYSLIFCLLLFLITLAIISMIIFVISLFAILTLAMIVDLIKIKPDLIRLNKPDKIKLIYLSNILWIPIGFVEFILFIMITY